MIGPCFPLKKKQQANKQKNIHVDSRTESIHFAQESQTVAVEMKGGEGGVGG